MRGSFKMKSVIFAMVCAGALYAANSTGMKP